MLLTHAAALLAIGGLSTIFIIHSKTTTTNISNDSPAQIIDIPPMVPEESRAPPSEEEAIICDHIAPGGVMSSPNYSGPRVHARDLRRGEPAALGLPLPPTTTSNNAAKFWGWSVWESMLPNQHQRLSGSGPHDILPTLTLGRLVDFGYDRNCDCGHRGAEGEAKDEEEEKENEGGEKKGGPDTADLLPYLLYFFLSVFLICVVVFCLSILVLSLVRYHGCKEMEPLSC
jgi:hypothetical protein